MSKKQIRNEWEQYALEKGKEYSLEEVISKFREAVNFITKDKVRLTGTQLIDPKKFKNEFRLNEHDKECCIEKYSKKGYTTDECLQIVKIEDEIYHIFNIGKEEVESVTDYCLENSTTLTNILQEQYGISIDDFEEFTNTVLFGYVSYVGKTTLKNGKELADILNEVLN